MESECNETTDERELLLADAGAAVLGGREEAYGSAEDSFSRIASFWGAYLAVDIAPRDVANMMVLLKVARNARGGHRDNWVDIAGYAACGSAAEFGGGRHGE